MADSFFISLGDGRYQPTDHTIGPWDAGAQHGGPPAALLGRVIEGLEGGAGKRIARVTFDILAPVPTSEIEVTGEVVRAGKRVDLCHASISSAGKVVMRASAWRFRETQLDLPEPPAEEIPGPEDGTPVELFASPASHTEDYYLKAMDIRFVEGAFLEPGPAVAWFRARYPLVEGEDNSPLTSVLIAVDSASGISAELDTREWLFINTDLSVYLSRYPVSDWVCVDAVSIIEPTGIGLAGSTIRDERGVIGRGSQSLLVDTR